MRSFFSFHALPLILATAASFFIYADAQAAEQGYPADETPWELTPPKLVDATSIVVCDFSDPSTPIDGWSGRANVTLTRLPDALEMRSSVDDPYFYSPEIDALPPGKLIVKFRASRQNTGNGQIFFNTTHSDFCEENSARFDMPLDSEAHDYVVELNPKEPIRRVRFDLGGSAGSAKLYRAEILALSTIPSDSSTPNIDPKTTSTSSPSRLQMNLTPSRTRKRSAIFPTRRFRKRKKFPLDLPKKSHSLSTSRLSLRILTSSSSKRTARPSNGDSSPITKKQASP